MADFHWKNAVSGFFRNPLDWSPSGVPGPHDNAILDASGGAYTVEVRSGLLGLALGGTEIVNSIQTASNANLFIVGDIDALDLLAGNTNFRAVNGTGGGVNAGRITVQDAVFVVPIIGTLLGASAQLEIGGVFDNTGSIVLNGQPHLLGLLDADQSTVLKAVGATTLTGGGHVTMSNERLNIITGTANASLTNVDNTISGSGFIHRLAFTNEAAGVIDANQTENLVVATEGVFTNRGLLEASNRGVLVATGSFDNTSGGVIAANGGNVGLRGATVHGGTLTSSGHGVVVATFTGSVLDGAGESVKNTGDVWILQGSNLTIEGAIVNSDLLRVGTSLGSHSLHADLLIGGSGATLSGHGEVLLVDSGINRILSGSAAATLDNVDNRIAGAGQIGDSHLTLVNEAAGVIEGTTATGLTINTGANVIQNAGAIYTVSGGVLTIVGAINNDGILAANGGVTTVDGAVSGTGKGVVRGGTLDFASTFNQDVFFGGAGTLQLDHSQSYSGVIHGFSKTDATALDLRDIAFTGSGEASFSGNAAGGILTVSDGTHTARIHLAGNYLGSIFTASSDGHGGVNVIDPPAAAAQRFAAAAASVAAPPAAHATTPTFQASSAAGTLLAPHAH